LFSEISLIIAIGTFFGLIMRLLKQPLIIGHIITGILIGPSVLDLVEIGETVEVFSKIGIALLLFIIGIGLNPKVIRELGRVSSITGVIQVSLTTLIGFGAATVMGYSGGEALAIGVGISFSSTIIILKLLSDKKEQTRLYGKISIGLLLIQDIIATLVLLATSALSEGSLSFNEFGVLALKGLVLAGILTIASAYILPHINSIIAGSQEFLFLFALGWGLGISSFFEVSGFSIEIGALFAGVALASLPYAQEISARLRPLRDFFIVLFFIELGLGLQIDGISEVIVPVAVLSVLVIIIKPLIIMTILGFMEYTKHTSFKAGIAMAQVSEFSLVFAILALHEELISQEVVTILTLTALFSIGVSTYLILYTDKLYTRFEHGLRLFEKRKITPDRESHHQFQMALFGYHKGGLQFVKTFKSLHKKFVIVDYDPDVIDHLEHSKQDYIYGDVTDIELLDELGVDKIKLIVSTITDHQTNMFLASHISKANPRGVLILHAETPQEAAELYSEGATYVLMPHYIGSERIGAFIKKNGFKKSEFKKYAQKHLLFLQQHVD